MDSALQLAFVAVCDYYLGNAQAQVSLQEKRECNLAVVHGLMHQYYKEQRKANPEDRVYALNRLTMGMIGPVAKPSLRAKVWGRARGGEFDYLVVANHCL